MKNTKLFVLLVISMFLSLNLIPSRAFETVAQVSPTSVDNRLVNSSRQEAESSPCSNYSAAVSVPGRYIGFRGLFLLDDSDNSQFIQIFNYGPAQQTWIPVSGDWDGDGFDSIGLYDPVTSTFHLRNSNTSGVADLTVQYGAPNAGWLPIVGDWNNDGIDTVGLYSRSLGRVNLRNTNTPGFADIDYLYGPPGNNWNPLAGDWNGDGFDSIGLFNPSDNKFYLRNSNTSGVADLTFQYGGAGNGWQPIIGDWNGDGTDTIGLWDGGLIFHLRNSNTGGNADVVITTSMTTTPETGKRPIGIAGKWKPSQCRLAGQNTTPAGPPWVKDMILYQMRIETFTPSGTLTSAKNKLTELSDLGVTGLVLNPVGQYYHQYPNPVFDIGYASSQPDKVDPRLGTDSDFQAFVAEAHRLGMKVLIDNVTNGIHEQSPYITSFPSDWFRRFNGTPLLDWGRQVQMDWGALGLQDWWGNYVVDWVRRFDIDGIRVDLEPIYMGCGVWGKIRQRVLQETGKQFYLLSEIRMTARGYAFDHSQRDSGYGETANGSDIRDFFGGTANVVDEVKSDPASIERFKSSTLSNHDYFNYSARGRIGPFTYGCIISPMIPHFFMGEEFNAPFSIPSTGGTPSQRILYFSVLDWDAKFQPSNQAFYQDVKKLIQIRKTYQNIIAPAPNSLNQVNITKVINYNGADLQPYALWQGNTAILVSAKRTLPGGPAFVNFIAPITEMGMNSYPFFRITDLLNGTESYRTRVQMDSFLSYVLEPGGAAVLKIEGLSGCSSISITPTSLPNATQGVSYNRDLTATGGLGGVTFSISAGALPQGLTLSATGTISGTPISSGSANFTVTATDSVNCTGSRQFSMTVTQSADVVQFSSPTYRVREGTGSVIVTVVRTGSGSIPATVQYATANGTAVAPGDYTPSTGTLSFGAGEFIKNFTITILADSLNEADETVNLTLSNPIGITLGSQVTSVVTIVDSLSASPVVTRFYPIASTSGKTMTIFGSGFIVGSTQVFFGGSRLIPAGNVTVVNSGTMTLTIPNTGTGTNNINGFLTVRANGLEATSQGLPIDIANPGSAGVVFPEFVLWGDVTGDGLFLTNDVTLVRGFLLFQAIPTLRQLLALDVVPNNSNGSRGDGQMTATDFTFLRAVTFGQTSF